MTESNTVDFSDIDELADRMKHLFIRLAENPTLTHQELFELTGYYFAEEARLINFQRQQQYLNGV